MFQLAEASCPLGCGWFEFFGDVNIPKIVLAAEIVDRKPFHLRDSFVVGQLDSEVFIEVAFQDVCSRIEELINRFVLPPLLNSLSKFIRNDEALRPRSVTRARPKERVDPVAIVIEIYDQERAGINRVNISADLVMVRVEFSYELPPVWTVLVILAVDYKAAQK